MLPPEQDVKPQQNILCNASVSLFLDVGEQARLSTVWNLRIRRVLEECTAQRRELLGIVGILGAELNTHEGLFLHESFLSAKEKSGAAIKI